MNDEQLSEWLSRRITDEGGLTREFFALRAENERLREELRLAQMHPYGAALSRKIKARRSGLPT